MANINDKVACDLSSTMEDYLEAIYTLQESSGVARVGEIAKKLHVKSPTVNSALKCLSEQDLVSHQKYGFATLTKKGELIALQVKKKHDILFRFLTEFLMLEPYEAETEACRIEHAISKKTFQRLVKLFDFMEQGQTKKGKKVFQTLKQFLQKNIADTEK